MRVAVIGSGIAAISAARSLIERGIKPVILDAGGVLDDNRKRIVLNLSSLEPDQWNEKEREFIASNPTVHGRNSLPMKLAFGSDYFYGKSTSLAPVETDGVMPPFSYAKGGFSVGWGATVLPPDDCDLKSWPIRRTHLADHFKKILNRFPYSACDDQLSEHFPVYSESAVPLNLTIGNTQILKELSRSNRYSSEDLSFGQSRLLVQAENIGTQNGCKYCGYCMSGCPYGCIYKSTNELDEMISAGLVEYVSGVLVYSLKEKNDKVIVSYFDKDKKEKSLVFDRVFLGAGAVGSTRIVMQSKQLYETKVRLLSTVGFVAPMLKFKSIPLDWPSVNTQPGIFLEFKVRELSDHWVHTQLSTPNEMVFDMLGIDPMARGFVQTIKKKIAQHLVIANSNLHSDHANAYFLSVRRERANGIDMLISEREENINTNIAIKKAINKLSSVCREFGCYTLTPYIQDSIKSGGFHVGGSLPMRHKPEKETDTNLLGNPKGWKRIHVVDSSVFPSLPGTTIGLLAMANAARIVSEVEL